MNVIAIIDIRAEQKSFPVACGVSYKQGKGGYIFMTDVFLNGPDSEEQLDDSVLEEIAGGYSPEEIAELLRRAEKNIYGEGDDPSPGFFQDGMGRKKPGSMGTVKR